MKIMLDLNIFMDVFQERTPHYQDSSMVLTKVLNKEVTGCIAGHCLTTLYYLLSRSSNKQKALDMVDWVLTHFEVGTAMGNDFIRSRTFDMKDFEDAVVSVCAVSAACDYIVTRNLSDFTNSPVRGISPGNFLKTL